MPLFKVLLLFIKFCSKQKFTQWSLFSACWPFFNINSPIATKLRLLMLLFQVCVKPSWKLEPVVWLLSGVRLHVDVRRCRCRRPTSCCTLPPMSPSSSGSRFDSSTSSRSFMGKRFLIRATLQACEFFNDCLGHGRGQTLVLHCQRQRLN